MKSACAVLYRHPWSVWLHHKSLPYLINETIFGRMLLNIKRVFDFLYCLVWNISHCKKNSEFFISIHVKYSLFLPNFNKTCLFSTCIRKMLRCLISCKFASLEPSCSMRTNGRTDGRTDMTKPIVAFRDFSNARNKIDVLIFNFYPFLCVKKQKLMLLHITRIIFTFRFEA
jgi:hypothetical protein